MAPRIQRSSGLATHLILNYVEFRTNHEPNVVHGMVHGMVYEMAP
jgi:hypothetical protein